MKTNFYECVVGMIAVIGIVVLVCDCESIAVFCVSKVFGGALLGIAAWKGCEWSKRGLIKVEE